MPRFEPFTESTPLPVEGEGYEREVFDLKTKAELTTEFHKAKDIAAFANHLGGTLLIGVKEEHGRVGTYVAMTEPDLNAIQSAFSKALERCSPKALAIPVRRAHPKGWLLAINVWPSVGQLIGVRARSLKDAEGFGDYAYVFPVRTIVDAMYLRPEQLPMFMLPEIRRVTILLQQIPRKEEVLITIGITGSLEGNSMKYRGRIVEIDELRNVVSFEDYRAINVGPTNDGAQHVIPLDQVRTVVKRPNGWLVSVHKFE